VWCDRLGRTRIGLVCRGVGGRGFCVMRVWGEGGDSVAGRVAECILEQG